MSSPPNNAENHGDCEKVGCFGCRLWAAAQAMKQILNIVIHTKTCSEMFVRCYRYSVNDIHFSAFYCRYTCICIHLLCHFSVLWGKKETSAAVNGAGDLMSVVVFQRDARRVLPLLWGMLGGQRGLVWTQWAALTNGSRWPQLNLHSYKNTPSVSRRGTLCLCQTVIKRFCHFLRCDPVLQEQSLSRWNTRWHLLQMLFVSSGLQPLHLRMKQERKPNVNKVVVETKFLSTLCLYNDSVYRCAEVTSVCRTFPGLHSIYFCMTD